MLFNYFRSIFSLFIFVNAFSCFKSKGELRTLNEDTWSEMLEGEWMVEFFAPWCPACQQLQPIWKEFAEWSDDLNIKVGSVDVTLNPGLSGRFMITALPTIFHVKDGTFRQFRGSRDKDSFINFFEEKKWTAIDPVPKWKSPQSFQMATVAEFFKFSMAIRNLHNTMVQDYGIPYWGSYIIFGVAVVLLGSFLGLILVCVVDFFCRPKSSGYKPVETSVNTSSEEREMESEDEYEGEDVIKDGPPDAELRRRKETQET